MITFSNTKYKLSKLWNNIITNESTIDFLKLSQVHTTNCNSFERFINNTLTHVPKLYDLYNFGGITYSTSPQSPSENYNFDGVAYTFNLPVFGYRVENGLDPVTISGGSGPWTFIGTVSVNHTRVNYLNLPDEYIKKSKVITYLYTDDNAPMPSFELIINPYTISKTTTDFRYFYRWIKVTDGYILDFYSCFLYSNDVDVKVKTNVYFIAKDLGNEIQSNII